MRKVLCFLGLHKWRGLEVPHTYKCDYCPALYAGHP